MEKNQTNNLLLLSFEGVLLKSDDAREVSKFVEYYVKTMPFDKDCIRIVNEFCNKTGAKIILISNLRKRFYKHHDLILQNLKEAGLDESHLTKKPFARYTMSSSKAQDIILAISDFNKKKTKTRTIVISDFFDESALNNDREDLLIINTDPKLGLVDSDLNNVDFFQEKLE